MMFGNHDRTLQVATQAVELLLANEKLIAENTALREQLLEAKNLLRARMGYSGKNGGWCYVDDAIDEWLTSNDNSDA